MWLRVTHDRRSRYVSTGVSVPPADWNPRRRAVRASHELADAYNAKLADLVAQARTAALSAPDVDAVMAALAGEGPGDFSGFLDRYIGRLSGGRQRWERKKFETLKRKLTGALGWPLTWADLSPDGLARFAAWLRAEAKNGPNTVRKELGRLRRVARLAVREGEIEPGADPFLRYKMPKGAPVNRRRLTPAEVDKLLGLGPADGVAPGSRLAAVRDLFALQFYTLGARVGDALRLTPDDVRGGRVVYRMNKTEEPVKAPVPPPLAPVLARLAADVEARDDKARRRFGRYLVPLLKPGDDDDPESIRRRINSANVIANRELKKLAALANIDPDGLSTHGARHAFADAARKMPGASLHAIRDALGHKNLSTTERYLASFDADAVDDLSAGLWGSADDDE